MDKKGTMLNPFEFEDREEGQEESSEEEVEEEPQPDDNKDEKEEEYLDTIGDIEQRLRSNGCKYHREFVKRHSTSRDKLLIRCIKQSFDKFKETYHLQTGYKKQSTFPRMRRFCTLVDRRQKIRVTTDYEKPCKEDKQKRHHCATHKHTVKRREQQSDMADGGVLDDVYFWIPPSNCDSLPDDKSGYVAEVYFENLEKCVVPRIGYADNLKKSKTDQEFKQNEDQFIFGSLPECKALRESITNANQTAGLLTFSFHVESEEEIRCYLWWKGMCIRFLKTDLLDILPLIFDAKYGNNAIFTQNDNIKELVEQIKITDRLFEQWYAHFH